MLQVRHCLSYDADEGSDLAMDLDNQAGSDSEEEAFETDPKRLVARQKQIDFGKNTPGYVNYVKAVPKDKRKRFGKDHDPPTPDITVKMSKKAWDGVVKAWRRHLHRYDNWEEPAQATNGGSARGAGQAIGLGRRNHRNRAPRTDAAPAVDSVINNSRQLEQQQQVGQHAASTPAVTPAVSEGVDGAIGSVQPDRAGCNSRRKSWADQVDDDEIDIGGDNGKGHRADNGKEEQHRNGEQSQSTRDHYSSDRRDENHCRSQRGGSNTAATDGGKRSGRAYRGSGSQDRDHRRSSSHAGGHRDADRPCGEQQYDPAQHSRHGPPPHPVHPDRLHDSTHRDSHTDSKLGLFWACSWGSKCGAGQAGDREGGKQRQQQQWRRGGDATKRDNSGAGHYSRGQRDHQHGRQAHNNKELQQQQQREGELSEGEIDPRNEQQQQRRCQQRPSSGRLTPAKRTNPHKVVVDTRLHKYAVKAARHDYGW
eukprot:GHRR01015034.1.p1 GENE.GHRR01015034.1~~GHRR01015034.1.p1  ORF type:complete len:479 (+),score=189.51 GHRR01015034.1:320-1756(+)